MSMTQENENFDAGDLGDWYEEDWNDFEWSSWDEWDESAWDPLWDSWPWWFSQSDG